MNAISRSSLLTLEAYARQRLEIRSRVLAHKKRRTLHLGAHLTLIFEDETTMRYQIQEMLRIEKTFEESGIQDELDAYNPLIPDSDRYVFSLGVGKTYKKFRWDVAYQCLWGPTRTVSTDTQFGGVANGSYEFIGNAISINFGYRF